jgi:hypothetical protein
MILAPGDKVRLKNTGEYHQGHALDGLTAIVLEGPFTETDTRDIQLYKIRIEENQIGPESIDTKCTWSALQFLVAGPDREYFEAVQKWERQLND